MFIKNSNIKKFTPLSAVIFSRIGYTLPVPQIDQFSKCLSPSYLSGSFIGFMEAHTKDDATAQLEPFVQPDTSDIYVHPNHTTQTTNPPSIIVHFLMAFLR